MGTDRGHPPLVIITGGAVELRSTIPLLPANVPACICVVHLIRISNDIDNSENFADSLRNWATQLKVRVLQTGDMPEPGIAYVAKNNSDLVLKENLKFDYDDTRRADAKD